MPERLSKTGHGPMILLTLVIMSSISTK